MTFYIFIRIYKTLLPISVLIITTMRVHICFCFLVVCFLQVSTLEVPDSLYDKYTLECMEQLKIDKSALVDAMDDKFYVNTSSPLWKNSKIKDFMECSASKRKLFKDDGEIDVAQLKDQVINGLFPFLGKENIENKSAEAEKILEICKNPSGDDILERSSNFHNCVVDHVHKL